MELWFIPDLLGFYPYRILRRLWYTSANLRGDDTRDMFVLTWRSRDIAAPYQGCVRPRCCYSEMLSHLLDITPRRYYPEELLPRGAITPRLKYPRYVRSDQTRRSRNIIP
jgi:hypothetical protein